MDITVIDDKLRVLVCKAHNIDAEEYPEMMDLINRFLVLDPEEQDYSELANNLMDADVSKRMPNEYYSSKCRGNGL